MFSCNCWVKQLQILMRKNHPGFFTISRYDEHQRAMIFSRWSEQPADYRIFRVYMFAKVIWTIIFSNSWNRYCFAARSPELTIIAFIVAQNMWIYVYLFAYTLPRTQITHILEDSTHTIEGQPPKKQWSVGFHAKKKQHFVHPFLPPTAPPQSWFFVSSLPFPNHFFFVRQCTWPRCLITTVSLVDHLSNSFYKLAGKKTLPQFASQTFFRSQQNNNPEPQTPNLLL